MSSVQVLPSAVVMAPEYRQAMVEAPLLWPSGHVSGFLWNSSPHKLPHIESYLLASRYSEGPSTSLSRLNKYI